MPHDLVVLFEHPEWQKPLWAALDRRGENPRVYYQVQEFTEFYVEDSRRRVEARLQALVQAARERVAQAMRAAQ